MASGGDEEIAAELPWGLEDDATGLDTYLAFHHPSCYAEQRYAQAAIDVVDAEGPQGTGWLAERGEVPMVPLRAVPRGVVDQVHKLCVVALLEVMVAHDVASEGHHYVAPLGAAIT